MKMFSSISDREFLEAIGRNLFLKTRELEQYSHEKKGSYIPSDAKKRVAILTLYLWKRVLVYFLVGLYLSL